MRRQDDTRPRGLADLKNNALRILKGYWISTTGIVLLFLMIMLFAISGEGWMLVIICAAFIIVTIAFACNLTAGINGKYSVLRYVKKLSAKEYAELEREYEKCSVIGDISLTEKHLISSAGVMPYSDISGAELYTQKSRSEYRVYYFNRIAVYTKNQKTFGKKRKCQKKYRMEIPMQRDDAAVDKLISMLKEKCGGELRVTGAFEVGYYDGD